MKWFCQALRRVRRHDVRFLIAFVLLAVVFAIPNQDALFHSLDRLYFELLSTLQTEDDEHDVVLVNVDQATVQALGREEVNGNVLYASLLERLSQADSVALNMNLMSRRDEGMLANAIRRHGRVVLALPAEFQQGEGRDGPGPSAVYAAAAGQGHRELLIGDRSVVTGIVPYKLHGEKLAPHMVMEAIRVAGYELPPRENTWCFAALWRRCTPQADGWLLVLPAQHHIQQYSMLDVLTGAVPRQAFHNKIVFVGHLALDPFKGLRANRYPLDREGHTRSQILALQTQTLMNHGPVAMLAAPYKLLVNFGIMFVLLLICLLTPPARMHVRACLWLGGCWLVSTLLLLQSQVWIPVSSPLIGGLLIYAGCAWRWQTKTHLLLRQEMAAMQLSLREAGMNLPLRAQVTEAGADEIERLMRQMRAWQNSYASVLNMLPYPIFFEQGGKIILSNQAARKLLCEHGASDKAEAWVLDLAAPAREKALRSGGIGVEEVRSGQGEHMLLVTPCQELCDGLSSSLISLVDLQNVKASVSGDRRVLRQMAHDLRNPLTTMLAMIEQRGGETGPRQDQFFNDLRRQVHYSLRVAQDFMQLSRAEQLDPSSFLPVALTDLAEDAMDQIEASARQKRITLHGPETVEALWVRGHYDMLLRAVVNVLDNAVKYSPPNSHIVVRLERWGEMAGISVTDQGIGIPEHALPRLFELFYQVDEGRRDGAGLGLPFVKAVMQSHGGRVEVKSQSRLGSEFLLLAPKIEAEKELGACGSA